MKLTEYQAKALLAECGVPAPEGRVVSTAADAGVVATELGGSVAVKAQVRSGGRGKAGGIVLVESAEAAVVAATGLLGMSLGGVVVEELLVEQAVQVAEEHYLSVTIDPSLGRPLIMTSAQGGIEVESMTEAMERTVVPPAGLTDPDPITALVLKAFGDLDALMVEINPLAVTTSGDRVALDAKIELDDSAAFRHVDLFASLRRRDAETPTGTERERAAAELGLRLIELGGDVAVLANGAGLTMATMDAIVSAGGAPANFLEIGGDAYTKATPALELVLSQPGVRSLLVNFCGAFARCDVMTAGVIEALTDLAPNLPVAFSISGTGQDEARQMVRDRLGTEPHPSMQSAVAAAVAAAGGDRS